MITRNQMVLDMQSRKWAMEQRALEAFFHQVNSLSPEIYSLKAMSPTKPKPLQVSGSVATINISGVLLKTVPGWLRYFGIEATGYDEITAQLK